MATFNCGSFNFGIFQVHQRAGDGGLGDRVPGVHPRLRLPQHLQRPYRLSELFREAGTKPEYEAYDVGHLYNLHHLAEQGLVDFPFHVQFVLGVLGANAASIEQLLHMRRTAVSLFGEDRFTWSAAGVGYPGQFHLAASALMLGGHMRVGLEDNLRVRADKRADSNAELVEKAVELGASARRRAGGRGRGAHAARPGRSRVGRRDGQAVQHGAWDESDPWSSGGEDTRSEVREIFAQHAERGQLGRAGGEEDRHKPLPGFLSLPGRLWRILPRAGRIALGALLAAVAVGARAARAARPRKRR